MPARSSETADFDREAYHVALDGTTRYGLMTAVVAILKGKLGHGFFPSPPELRMQCDLSMKPHVEARERIARQERIRREMPAPVPHHTPEQRARVAAAYERFCARHKDNSRDGESAEIRARYGMTDEILASIPDRPLDSNWQKAG